MGDVGLLVPSRQSRYGMDSPDMRSFFDYMNREIVVIGKIEEAEALDHLDDILQTPIDGLVVGGTDLSASLHIPEARGQ